MLQVFHLLCRRCNLRKRWWSQRCGQSCSPLKTRRMSTQSNPRGRGEQGRRELRIYQEIIPCILTWSSSTTRWSSQTFFNHPPASVGRGLSNPGPPCRYNKKGRDTSSFPAGTVQTWGSLIFLITTEALKHTVILALRSQYDRINSHTYKPKPDTSDQLNLNCCMKWLHQSLPYPLHLQVATSFTKLHWWRQRSTSQFSKQICS
jgi:hypothetical protein